MSQLIRLIDAHRAANGMPSEASIARAIGVAPQTLNSWRNRGIRELPSRDTLKALAQLLRVDFESTVLKAALVDTGWVVPTVADPVALRLLEESRDEDGPWRPQVALQLLAHEPDSPGAYSASDAIRSLINLTSDDLIAARRSAKWPPGMAPEGL